jgi:hypothetical protein
MNEYIWKKTERQKLSYNKILTVAVERRKYFERELCIIT